jgi:hypothetical protein
LKNGGNCVLDAVYFYAEAGFATKGPFKIKERGGCFRQRGKRVWNE